MATSSEAEESKIIHSRRRCKVLLCGHQASGKSTAKRKIIDLSMSMYRSAGVQSSGDLESTVDKIDNRLVEGARVEFQGVKYNTKTSTYEFVMAPSHHHYVPNMMSRALQADIAVLFVSGLGDDDISKALKDLQSEECANMVIGLGITKVLLVITKMDDFKSRRYERIKERMVSDLKHLGFGNDFQCIPVSFEDGENIDSQRGKDSCFFDALDAIELTAYDKRTMSIEDESNFIKSLVRVDLLLDENSSDATSWYDRAILLEKISNKSKYQGSVELEKANRQTQIAWGQVQAANISNYMASLEAAENAAKFGLFLSKKEEDMAVPYLVQGYQCRAENKLEAACAHFESAVELFRKKIQLKNNNAVVTKLEEILRDMSKQLEESKETSSTASREKRSLVVDKKKDKKRDGASREKRSLVVDEKKDKKRDGAEVEDFARAPSHKKDADVVKPRYKQKDKVSSTSHKKNEDEVKPCDEGNDEVSSTSHKKNVDEVKPRDEGRDEGSAPSYKKDADELEPRDKEKDNVR